MTFKQKFIYEYSILKNVEQTKIGQSVLDQYEIEKSLE